MENTAHNSAWQLTDSDREIIQYMAEGLTAPEISKYVHKQKGTIKARRSKIYRKLNITGCKLVNLALITLNPQPKLEGGKVYFTRKEIEVAELIAKGITTREIIASLNITWNNIKANYLTPLYAKTGSQSKVMFAIWWKEHGHEAKEYSQSLKA